MPLSSTTGPRGPVGPSGDRGSAWTIGTAIPLDQSGKDGDCSLVGGTVYYKAAGTWSPTSLNLTGPQGPAGQAGGATLEQVYPVGSVYISTVSTSPDTLFGFGTWIRLGEGRTLVSQSAGDADFDTVKETGGAKTVTLQTTEMPAHNHAVTDPGHVHAQMRFPTATGASIGFTVDTSMSGTPATANNTGSATTGITIQNTGGGGAHNNMPPYIVVYIWERTA